MICAYAWSCVRPSPLYPVLLYRGPIVLLLYAVVGNIHAAHPVVERLGDYPVDELIAVENGSVEQAKVGGRTAWRWRIDAGQTSRLSIRHDHPLFDRLRYYDRLQMQYRVAEGEIHSLELDALGHVTGPRQYKVHNFRIAISTTPRAVWHHEELDLARPYWFPWDTSDGEGEDGYFRFEAMAIAPDTVIELADVSLMRGLIYLKPDYELPVTWPVKTVNDDGSVTHSMTFRVLNTSGCPTDITARVESQHKHFHVSLDSASQPVEASRIATFNLAATISRHDIQGTPELYTEPLRIVFSTSHRPEVTTWWLGRLVRPLSQNLRRQVILSDSDVEFLREKIKANDDPVKRLIEYDKIIARADEFVAKTLQTIPLSYGHVRNGYPRPWRPGDVMSEAVNPETGERRFGDHTAGAVWREYLAYSGQATYYTGLAYLLTEDERYAQKAIELMRLYAQQYAQRKWHNLFEPPYFRGMPILTSSRIASNSSYGSNWEFKWFCKMASMIADSPSWTDEDRQLVYEGFVLPYVTELAKLPGHISNQTDITNHNLLVLGIVFDDAHMVYLATQRDCGLISRLQDIDADGFSSEGRPLNYHHAAADEYLPSVTHLENSGLKIAYGKERILAAVRMPFYRATLSGLVPNTGDCGRGQRIGPNRLADILAGIAPDQKWLVDAGRGSTIPAKLRRHRQGIQPERDRWKKLLENGPRLFPHAGFAILRAGDTPETQIMLTLDYGRNVFHGALDRNQITLFAFGKVFTHGPGSLYNAGSGGIKYNEDPRLKSFNDGRVSLANNVIVVDQTSQLTCVGQLLAWSDRPDFQVAVSRVNGIRPGVSHTRGVVLTNGTVLIFDRVESDEDHEVDFVYHNFGELTFAQGWQTSPTTSPGKTGNYDNLVDPVRLQGNGSLKATWDLTRQYPHWRKDMKVDESSLPPIHLAFWHLPIDGGRLFSGSTGLNNSNTMIISDQAPSIIHRVSAKQVEYVTVLEPYKEKTSVASVERDANQRIIVTWTNGKEMKTSIDELIAGHAFQK